MNANSTKTTQDNISKPVTDMEHLAPEESRPPKPSRNVDYHSDWSNLEDMKDDQARAKPVDVQDPQPSTSYMNESAPLRCLKPSDEMESIHGDPIYPDDDCSTSEPG